MKGQIMKGKSLGLNRRQSVRVEDRILFGFAEVPEEEFKSVSIDFNHGISLYNQDRVACMRQFIGAQSALNNLRSRDSDLADYLQYMDTKLNILLRNVDRGTPTPFDSLAMQKVSLSANGISFLTSAKLASGQILDLHIVLLPDYSYIYCFGQVVSEESAGEEDGKALFRVAAKYVLIMDEDREKLFQHSFKHQSLALRNRRGSKSRK